VGRDATMRPEFLRLFSFADNSAHSEFTFESKNQRLESNVSRYAGDLGNVSNASLTPFERGTYENEISCHFYF
jgi:hypothetical protein